MQWSLCVEELYEDGTLIGLTERVWEGWWWHHNGQCVHEQLDDINGDEDDEDDEDDENDEDDEDDEDDENDIYGKKFFSKGGGFPKWGGRVSTARRGGIYHLKKL